QFCQRRPPGPQDAGTTMADWRQSMIALRPALNDYLAMRRALGYKLERAEKLLAQFIRFVEVSGSERITIDLALAWATLPAQGAMDWWAGRLTVVRGFATYLHTIDSA